MICDTGPGRGTVERCYIQQKLIIRIVCNIMRREISKYNTAYGDIISVIKLISRKTEKQ